MNRRQRALGNPTNGHGLYFHSSPPKALVIKPSNIRIWVHNKDIDKLMRVVLEGHGQKLRSEVANQPKVKRFLEYVPHFLGLIKNIHQAVIDNNIETLQSLTSPPVPPQMLACKDVNGLNPLHKAAGLAHTKIVEYILAVWPNAARDLDGSGKSPLHYAASTKNNERVFNLLVQAGADEPAMDRKGHPAAFYKKNKNSEDLDRNQLNFVPDAPRVAEQGFPPGFDWNFLPPKFFESQMKSAHSDMNISRRHNGIGLKVNEFNGNGMKASSSAFELLNNSKENLNEEEPEAKLVKKTSIKASRPRTFVKNDINNNSSKHRESPEANDDDDDVETVRTADAETLLPEKQLMKSSGIERRQHFEQDYPSDPNETDQNENEKLIEIDNDRMTDINEGKKDVQMTDEPNEEAYEDDFEGSKNERQHEETDEAFDGDLKTPDTILLENETEFDDLDELRVINDGQEMKFEDNLGDANELIEDEASKPEVVDEKPEVFEEKPEVVDNEEQEIENVPEVDKGTRKLEEIDSSPVADIETLANSKPHKDVEDNKPEIDDFLTEVDTEKLDEEDLTVVNHENYDRNNDSAYETIELNSQNGSDSRLQSADTNENEIDNETGENFIVKVQDIPQNIEIFDDEMGKTEMEDLTIERFINDSVNSPSPINDDDGDVVVSAASPTETGYGLLHNSRYGNKLEAKDEEQMDDDEKSSHVGSPSPPYEGVITEEPEKQLESQGGDFDAKKLNVEVDESDPIQKLVDSGDMEQLAMMVLNGQGENLIGKTTTQPDIQAFIDNIPTYMAKIRKVHVSAREGSLRDLQAALDRRKFSTAKDEVSPKGTTPLHVAVIFGHTAIIRYLGSRFQETLMAVDDDNRTALHYAATIKDNGHFFNLLVHLGANPKSVDNLGKTAEAYLEHDESDKILSHKDLLRTFGADETLADEMLNDQEFKNNQPVEIPLFRTEEGRYLATSLGDPLIKGLTEVANLRPTDPIAFLANYLHNFSTDKPKTTATKPQEAEKPTENHLKPKPEKILAIPVKQKSVENLLDDDDTDATPGSEERDEHGQSMLHFAAARQHGKNALFTLIEEAHVSVTYRDEIYRTARDVSLQASQPENCKEIDRFVLSLAARGDYETFVAMLLDGYDHLIDIEDGEGNPINKVARSRGHFELATFLDNLREFEENREKLLSAVRTNDFETVKEILEVNDGSKLARAKNYYGRCSLHLAVLLENEEIVEHLATNFRQTLRVGDNLERTALHYSMGINNVEAISRILIKNGAKRTLKDLKGRTASFYYINKSDILRLKEEEQD